MAFSPSSPVTGSAETGLTSPTYTLTQILAPDTNMKQYSVSALGGTQTGVTTHSATDPFTLAASQPKVFKGLPALNAQGQLRKVPKNVYKIIGRKGVTPLAGQPKDVAMVTVVFEIPAGSDIADAVELRALQSLVIGALSQISSSWGDTTVTGTL